MIDASKLDFHESTIIEFIECKGNIEIVCEEVFYGNEIQRNVTLQLNNVSAFETDAKDIQGNLMAAEDGEIIFLDLGQNTMKLVVEWNSFKNNIRFTCGYKISFENCGISFS